MTNKNFIYDELSRVLTDYENGTENIEKLYEMLVNIQNEWDVLVNGKIESE